MSVNKYKPHVWLIPEDDANRQLAVGFLNHVGVNDRVADIRTPAGGWGKVLDVFEVEYLPLLHRYQDAHVVMPIDFDGVEDRRVQFEQKIPDAVKSRVFVIGSKDNPEILRGELKMGFERIGGALAEDCIGDDFGLWGQPHLLHNLTELRRMVSVVKPILFGPS